MGAFKSQLHLRYDAANEGRDLSAHWCSIHWAPLPRTGRQQGLDQLGNWVWVSDLEGKGSTGRHPSREFQQLEKQPVLWRHAVMADIHRGHGSSECSIVSENKFMRQHLDRHGEEGSRGNPTPAALQKVCSSENLKEEEMEDSEFSLSSLQREMRPWAALAQVQRWGDEVMTQHPSTVWTTANSLSSHTSLNLHLLHLVPMSGCPNSS